MSCPTLTTEQENVIRHVLERNHTYYVAQGMSRPHMWPEELLSEIRNELDYDELEAQFQFVLEHGDALEAEAAIEAQRSGKLK